MEVFVSESRFVLQSLAQQPIRGRTHLNREARLPGIHLCSCDAARRRGSAELKGESLVYLNLKLSADLFFFRLAERSQIGSCFQ
jgi:hypothetical protein